MQLSKIGLVLDPEDGSGTFIRNVDELPSDDNAAHVRRQSSSITTWFRRYRD
jgi:hypothetical protein